MIDVSPAQAGRLADIVAGAPAGATIRLADGTYSVGTITMRRPGVTLRSASGNPSRVVLDARYGPSALIHPFANDLTVAELTLTHARDHLVHAYPAASGPDLRGLRLYRVRMVDSGEQFLKVNSNAARSAWVDSGTVACSHFLMTPAGRTNIERGFGCYTGGIDVHSGRGWRVRDSTFEGIYCEDGELAEHAIHFWKGARATVVENNVIENCARAIGFGLGDSGEGRPWADDPYPGVGYIGHYDGVIRGNSVLADISQYDTAIELAQARGTRVLHNTVVETARATSSFSSLDYRWPNTRVEVANNLTRRITARDGGQAALSHNLESFPHAWLVDPLRADFHLRPGQNGARDRGVAVVGAGLDIDGRTRGYGLAPDIGADEWSPAANEQGRSARQRRAASARPLCRPSQGGLPSDREAQAAAGRPELHGQLSAWTPGQAGEGAYRAERQLRGSLPAAPGRLDHDPGGPPADRGAGRRQVAPRTRACALAAALSSRSATGGTRPSRSHSGS